jgi:MFS transporter, OFA family, oxalate/formate antiporter
VSEQRVPNRWLIACAGVIMNVCVGTTYAWSVFTKPLTQANPWTQTQVTLTFTIAVAFVGLGSLLGGMWQDRKGPRLVSTTAGLFYGSGYLMAALAASNHWLPGIYIGYGLFCGLGIGAAHICSIATITKWFPDHRGAMTGANVMGFGAGALVLSPIAARTVIHVGVPETFIGCGIVYGIVVTTLSQFYRIPPDGWRPAGWQPGGAAAKAASAVDHTVSSALRTWRFWLLWAMLSLNTSAGIMILSQASPLSQQQTSIDAVKASFIVALLSIFNAAGRVFWAWISDFIGRAQTLFCLFALQVFLFFALPSIHEVVLFAIAAGVIAACYGGGFGVMPAFTADFFGAKYVGGIYGWILVGWGIAAIPSPLLMAHFRETTGTYDFMLYVIGGVMVVSLIFPILARRIVNRITAASAIEIEGSPAGMSAG